MTHVMTSADEAIDVVTADIYKFDKKSVLAN